MFVEVFQGCGCQSPQVDDFGWLSPGVGMCFRFGASGTFQNGLYTLKALLWAEKQTTQKRCRDKHHHLATQIPKTGIQRYWSKWTQMEIVVKQY